MTSNYVVEDSVTFAERNEYSDERLTLETSALETVQGGQFTLSTHFIKPNYLQKMWPSL